MLDIKTLKRDKFIMEGRKLFNTHEKIKDKIRTKLKN